MAATIRPSARAVVAAAHTRREPARAGRARGARRWPRLHVAARRLPEEHPLPARLATSAAGPGPLRPIDLGTVLSIWAHPDDETYLAGATMAAARAAGQRVVCVSATAGELGTADPVTWPPERLGPERRREAAAAMAVLGVEEHHVLGWPDGGLAGLPAGEGEAAVARLLDDLRPDTVLTFGPDGQTGHPDHVAVHRWVVAAWAGRGRRERLLLSTSTAAGRDRWAAVEGVHLGGERPAPTPVEALALHLLAGGAALRQKVAALAAMPTQTAPLRAAVGDARYAGMVAEEAFVPAS